MDAPFSLALAAPLTPDGRGQHLLDEARDHGASHDGAALPRKPERHEADPQVLRWVQHLGHAVHLHDGHLGADHERQAGAVHISVKDAHLQPARRRQAEWAGLPARTLAGLAGARVLCGWVVLVGLARALVLCGGGGGLC